MKKKEQNIINPLDIALVMSYIICTGKDLKEVKMTKDNWNAQFAEIENWLNQKGYKVNLGTDFEDRITWEPKEVFINSRSHPETRYYTLLHEAGHLLISQGAKQWAKDLPMYASQEDLRVEKSKAYRVSLVAEEIEAWKRGRRLGNRLNHYIDNDKYDKMITECVFGYIELAAVGCP